MAVLSGVEDAVDGAGVVLGFASHLGLLSFDVIAILYNYITSCDTFGSHCVKDFRRARRGDTLTMYGFTNYTIIGFCGIMIAGCDGSRGGSSGL